MAVFISVPFTCHATDRDVGSGDGRRMTQADDSLSTDDRIRITVIFPQIR